MSDIVERLREKNEWTNQRPYFHAHDKCIEAAAEIARLRAELAEARDKAFKAGWDDGYSAALDEAAEVKRPGTFFDHIGRARTAIAVGSADRGGAAWKHAEDELELLRENIRALKSQKPQED